MPPKTVLVMGATGNTGAAVLQALRERDVTVRAVSRSEREWPSGVEGVVADVNDPDGLRAASEGATGAYLLSGYAAEARALDTLQDAHVVLLSSSGAPSGDMDNAVARYHLESEQAVKSSGHAWTILQPNSFMANLLRAKDELDRGDTVGGPFGDVPVAMVDPDDIGAVAATALTEPGHAGRTYRLTGPEALTPAEQFAILGAAIGRDIRFEAWDDTTARTTMERDMPAEYVDAFFAFFRGGKADETTVNSTVQDILGRPPGDLAGWVARHVAAFAS